MSLVFALPPRHHRLRPFAGGAAAALSPQDHLREIFRAAGQSPERRFASASDSVFGEDRASWEALGSESDPAVFWAGVLNLTKNLERCGHSSAAWAVHQYAAEATAASPELAVLHRSFSEHRTALAGRGPLNATRLEFMGRRFAVQATDPSMLGAFAAATGLSQTVRTAGLASLAMRGGSAFWTQGLGARALAETLAFAAEVPAFVAAARGLDAWIGGSAPAAEGQSWSEALAGAAIFLGAMKITGLIAREIFRVTPVLKNIPEAGRALGSIGGVYAGQRLEETLDLRPSRAESDRWIDAADTWLQLMVGGRIAAAWFGAPPAMLSRAAADLPASLRISSLRFLESEPRGARVATAMEEFGDEITSPNLRATAPPLERLILSLGRRLNSQARLDAEQIGRLTSKPDAFYSLLERSQMQDAPRLQAALSRLRMMLSYTRTGGLRGDYPSWITRLAVDRLAETQDVPRLDVLLNVLYEGRSLPEFERVVGEILPEAVLETGGRRGRLRALGWYFGTNRELHLRIRTLPLSPRARGALQHFAARARENLGVVLDVFVRFLKEKPGQAPQVDAVLAHALGSPLGELRVHRLLQVILNHPHLHPKIAELADFDMPLRSWEGRTNYDLEPENLRNTAADAYLNDPVFTEYLTSFYRDLPRYSHVGETQARWERTQSVLEAAVPAARAISEMDVLKALRALGDSSSTRVLESLLNGRTVLRIEDDEPFLREARRFNPEVRGEHLQGFCICTRQGAERDTFYIRQIRYASGAAFHRILFNRLATLIHEFEHHLTPIELPGNKMSVLREEMIAHLRTIHWRAEHGDPAEAADRNQHPLGFGISLRNRVEATDLRHPDPEL